MSEQVFAAVQGVFRPKTRVSPRWVTAGRTLDRRHCLPGLHQHRVEVTAASALPSDLHRQLDDRRGDLRQCLNALCPELPTNVGAAGEPPLPIHPVTLSSFLYGILPF